MFNNNNNNNNYPQTSYQNQTAGNENLYDNSDLYEYDTDTKNPGNFISNAAGRVRSLFNGDGSRNENIDSDNASMKYKRDCLDTLCANINQTLIVPKAFYFFYFAAFGSLFPLMGIYFKQMAMTSLQVGILLGFRPFVEFISAPFWASVGERWRKGRIILLSSMLCWIIFTLAMGFVRVPAHSCTMLNETDVILEKPRQNIKNNIRKRDVSESSDQLKYLFNDYFLQEDLRLRIKRQVANDSKRYQFKEYKEKIKIKINKTTVVPNTTKAYDIKNKLETSQQTTTITKQPKEKPIKTTQEILNDDIVNSVADKTVEDIEKNLKTNDLNSTVNEVLDEIVSDFNLKISKTPDEEVSNKLTTKSGSKSNEKEKSNYYGSPPNNIDEDLVKPKLKTSLVYNKKDVRRVFFLFLFLLLAGEFFCAPAITIADSCTLQYLGPTRADLYGRQRMFGSIGWALAMFVIGLLLDQSKAFTEHPCGQAGPDERNYSVCFAIYSVLMGCAFVIATQFKFMYGDSEQIPLKQIKQKAKHQINKIRDSRFKQFDRQQFVNEDEDDEDNEYNGIDAEKPPSKPPIHEGYINTGFVEINNNDSRKEKYMRLLDTCKSVKHLTFLFIVWFMGIGVGLVFTFLFWHLQDLGGSPALYGIASVINHMSELMAYFFVHEIVRKFGHVNIFYAGLLGNFARFIYVALLTEPYWILPFEFIQGLTHALVWASATSYFAQSVPEDLRSTAQGILQGLHFGLGRGCGAVIGGLVIDKFGTKATFFSYGILCLVVLIGFIIINRFTHKAALSSKLMQNQFSTDDANVEVINSFNNNNSPQIHTNDMEASNIEDNTNDNYYYDQISPKLSNDKNHSSYNMPVFSPYGVPSSNYSYNKN